MMNRFNGVTGTVALALITVLGCGQPSAPNVVASQEPTIVVTPQAASIPEAGTAVFLASVTGTADVRVSWYVLEGSAGGSVSAGAYVAPQTPGTYHVVATSEADPNARGSATMTVGPPKVLSVGVSPTQASTTAGGALAFTATVTTSCGSFPAQ